MNANTIEKKNILIAGYYGFGNTGDEAILAAILSDLREGRQDLEFVVLSGNPVDTTALHNVHSILWTDLSAILPAVQKSDLVILGGGGIFHEYLGFHEEYLLTQSHAGLSFYAGLPLMAAMYKKPCMLYSVGVGPLFSEKGEQFLRLAFNLASVATVRDLESMSLLERLKIHSPKIRVTADPAYNLIPNTQKANIALDTQRISYNESLLRVAVCPRHWDINISEEQWQENLAKGLDWLAKDRDLMIIFVPFQNSPISPDWNDFSAAEAILLKMQYKECAKILEPSHDPEEVAGIISLCDMVIGMRLHSLIFAISAGVPIVGLVYDPKVENMLAQAKMDEYLIQLNELTPELLYKTVRNALNSRDKISNLLHSVNKKLRKLAGENGKIALQLLKQPSLSNRDLIDNDFIWGLATKQTELLAGNEQLVRTLSAQTEILQAHLQAITTSRTWKFAMLLQRIKKELIPEESRRHLILQKMYQWFGVRQS